MSVSENRGLWSRLEGFRVDDDSASLSFLDRVARENQWSRSFTDRVFVEYRRFVFLAMTAEHQVTPSEQVDQGWHLHLTYTRSYWNDLCGEVLDAPLHHQPTVGGPAQRRHWNDTYSQTLASYRRVFGSEPPSDIWPAPVERFAAAGALRWVDSSRYWAVPKRPVRRSAAAVAALGATLIVLTTFATAALAHHGEEPDSSSGPASVLFTLVFFGAVAEWHNRWPSWLGAYLLRPLETQPRARRVRLWLLERVHDKRHECWPNGTERVEDGLRESYPTCDLQQTEPGYETVLEMPLEGVRVCSRCGTENFDDAHAAIEAAIPHRDPVLDGGEACAGSTDDGKHSAVEGPLITYENGATYAVYRCTDCNHVVRGALPRARSSGGSGSCHSDTGCGGCGGCGD